MLVLPKTGESMIYTIIGPPVPLARARHTAYAVYDSQKTLRIHQEIELENQQTKPLLNNMPLRLNVTFYMPIPVSYSPKKRLETVGKPHMFKPDTSNLLKWIEDIATKIVYYDDCLISDVHATKVYDLNPRTEFTIVPYYDERG